MRAAMKSPNDAARAIALALTATVLSGCKDEVPVETVDDAERSAAGEVLGGTIRDDMLPLDRLRSQSPPMEGAGEDTATGNGDAPGGGTAPASGEAAPSAEPTAGTGADETAPPSTD